MEIDAAASLSESELDEMYSLFGQAFAAERAGFERDLREKDFVLRVRTGGVLEGFSTLVTLSPEPNVKLLFSGDTYSSERARVGAGLPGLWARYVFREMPRERGSEYYWLLLCSGFRTYRLLPTFFLRFCPGPALVPALNERLNDWAATLYGDRFSQGVVRPLWATPLREPEPPSRLAQDPHVKFFLAANPGYRAGDELACLASLATDNLTKAGRRLAL